MPNLFQHDPDPLGSEVDARASGSLPFAIASA
jgi:hypothetical protein